jgi:hypothetical protein
LFHFKDLLLVIGWWIDGCGMTGGNEGVLVMTFGLKEGLKLLADQYFMRYFHRSFPY